MRRTITILGIIAFVVVAYAVWPFVGLFQLASAIQAKDPVALTERVDFKALRKSLTKQILTTYLKLTGQEEKLGTFGSGLAMGYGRSIAAPIVERLVNEKTLLQLLTKGTVSSGKSQIQLPVAPFSSLSAGESAQTWWDTEYGFGDFYVYLPPNKPPEERIRVKLSLVGLQWRLAGIELPEPLAAKLTKEIIPDEEEKK
jgi:hypothetical protein